MARFMIITLFVILSSCGPRQAAQVSFVPMNKAKYKTLPELKMAFNLASNECKSFAMSETGRARMPNTMQSPATINNNVSVIGGQQQQSDSFGQVLANSYRNSYNASILAERRQMQFIHYNACMNKKGFIQKEPEKKV